MIETVSFSEIGDAIAHFSRRYPPVNYKICREARTLADVFGVMIYNRVESIPASDLNPTQAEALRVYRQTLVPPASSLDPAQAHEDDSAYAGDSEPKRSFPRI